MRFVYTIIFMFAVASLPVFGSMKGSISSEQLAAGYLRDAKKIKIEEKKKEIEDAEKKRDLYKCLCLFSCCLGEKNKELEKRIERLTASLDYVKNAFGYWISDSLKWYRHGEGKKPIEDEGEEEFEVIPGYDQGDEELKKVNLYEEDKECLKEAGGQG